MTNTESPRTPAETQRGPVDDGPTCRYCCGGDIHAGSCYVVTNGGPLYRYHRPKATPRT